MPRRKFGGLVSSRKGAMKKRGRFRRRPIVAPLSSGIQMAGWRINNSLVRTSTEKKYLDLLLTSPLTDGGALYGCPNMLAIGSNVTSRIGNQITPKSLYVRWTAYPTFLNSPQANFRFNGATVRCMIVLDTQPNNTLFSGPAQLGTLVNQGPGGVYTSMSQLNLNYRARFRVLSDKEVTLDAGSMNANSDPVGAGQMIRASKKFKILPKFVTTYSGDTGTEDIIATNKLLVIWLSDQLTSDGSSTVTIDATIRMRYTDL